MRSKKISRRVWRFLASYTRSAKCLLHQFSLRPRSPLANASDGDSEFPLNKGRRGFLAVLGEFRGIAICRCAALSFRCRSTCAHHAQLALRRQQVQTLLA